jgi:hypothetical protein
MTKYVVTIEARLLVPLHVEAEDILEAEDSILTFLEQEKDDVKDVLLAREAELAEVDLYSIDVAEDQA